MKSRSEMFLDAIALSLGLAVGVLKLLRNTTA